MRCWCLLSPLGGFSFSESSTVLRAFSTRGRRGRAAKHKRPRHDACNHRALLISRATLRTSHATCRPFASPKRRRRLFLLRGRVTSETSEARSKHAGAGGHAGTYPPIVRFTERGIHGAGDEPHCPIPLITVSNTRRRQAVQCTYRLQISGATTPTPSSGLLPNDAAAETSPGFQADICTCGRSPNSLGQRRASPHQRRPPTSSDTPGERDLLLFLLVQENHLSPLRRASRRTAPSGGRLYPLTLYVIASQAVGRITPGPYSTYRRVTRFFPLVLSARPSRGGQRRSV